MIGSDGQTVFIKRSYIISDYIYRLKEHTYNLNRTLGCKGMPSLFSAMGGPLHFELRGTYQSVPETKLSERKARQGCEGLELPGKVTVV